MREEIEEKLKLQVKVCMDNQDGYKTIKAKKTDTFAQLMASISDEFDLENTAYRLRQYDSRMKIMQKVFTADTEGTL